LKECVGKQRLADQGIDIDCHKAWLTLLHLVFKAGFLCTLHALQDLWIHEVLNYDTPVGFECLDKEFEGPASVDASDAVGPSWNHIDYILMRDCLMTALLGHAA